MRHKSIKQVIKTHFHFLESEFGFNLKKSSREEWGYLFEYLNGTTGVVLQYEFFEGYIFVTLYKLVNGLLIYNPIVIKSDSLLFGYGLDDIVSIRCPNDLPKPSYKYSSASDIHGENGLSLFVSLFAKNLKKHADDVLRGDFSIFSILDEIVKNRILNR